MSSIEVCERDYVFVLKQDGSVWGTGRLSDICGFARNGRTDFQDSTEYVKLWENVKQVSIDGHCLIVKSDNSLWGFGDNSCGQLGQGAPHSWKEYTDDQKWFITSPIKIMEDVQKSVAGTNCSIVLKTDGTLWSWGRNSSGQLGNGKPAEDFGFDELDNGAAFATEFPEQIMDGVIDFRFSRSFGAALKNDGSLWVWGAPFGLGGAILLSPTKIADGVKAFVNSPINPTLLYKTGDNTVWKYSIGDVCTSPINTQPQPSDKPMQIPLSNVSNLVIDNVLYANVKTDGSLWVYGWDSSHMFGIDNPDKYLDASKLISDLEKVTTPIQLTGYVGPTSTTSSGTGFHDVPTGAYYADAVAWAVDKGITTGTSSTTFSPGSTCTNGQILTFLWRAEGQPQPTVANPFTDVKEGDFCYQAALWAYEKGMVSGSSFNAGTPCTRSQTVTYLWTLAGQPEAASASAFDDVDSGAAYAQAVAWAVEKDITSGTSASTFAPDGTCTRGQIVTFLYRDMGK